MSFHTSLECTTDFDGNKCQFCCTSFNVCVCLIRLGSFKEGCYQNVPVFQQVLNNQLSFMSFPTATQLATKYEFNINCDRKFIKSLQRMKGACTPATPL